MPQPRAAHSQPRNPCAALGVGHVTRHRRPHRRPLRVTLLERDDPAEDPPVELGNRYLRGGIERSKPRVGLQPSRPRSGRAHCLEHRHVKRGKCRGVPFLPLLANPLAGADSSIGSPRPARREHRHDQRVHMPVEQRKRRHMPLRIAPQRVAPNRKRIRASLFDPRTKLIDERGVSCKPVRPVKAESDRGP